MVFIINDFISMARKNDHNWKAKPKQKENAMHTSKYINHIFVLGNTECQRLSLNNVFLVLTYSCRHTIQSEI
jgi:hypothetical protein